MNSKIKYKKILYKTPSHILEIKKYISQVNKKLIICDHVKFNLLCFNNCKNYGLKYSCPPFSPIFFKFTKKKGKVIVICFQFNLDQYTNLNIYNSIRAGNSILKSLIERELLSLRQKGFIVAGSGSCRACKSCGAKIGVPCKKPDRRIYSLEALGVNVNQLVKDCFGFKLQWYIPGKEIPEYTCVVGAVFV